MQLLLRFILEGFPRLCGELHAPELPCKSHGFNGSQRDSHVSHVWIL